MFFAAVMFALILAVSEACLSSGATGNEPVWMQFADTGQQISLAGTVTGYEKKTNSAGYFLSACILTDSGQKYPIDSKIYLYADDHTIPIGSVISVRGRLSLPEPAANPGQFDGVSYYRQKEVSALLFASDIVTLETPSFLPIRELARRLKTKLTLVLEQICTDEITGILEAMLLGDKTEISKDTKALFQNGGILHVLTISGMHLYLFGMGLYSLLLFFRLPVTPAVFLTTGLLWFYILLTGSGTAVLRAGIMFTVLLGGRLFERTYDQATALAVAVILLLLGNPTLIGNSSFQLSVTAILGTSVFLPGFTEQSEEEREAERASLRQRKNHRIWQLRRKLLRAVSSALVLNAVMLPLILFYFYELPVFSMAATLILLPSVSWLMISAAAGLLTGSIFLPLGQFLIQPAVWLLKGYFFFLKLLSAVPFSSVVLGKPRVWQIGVYALLLLILMRLAATAGSRRTGAWARIAPGKQRIFCMAVLPLLILFLLPVSGETFSVTLLDVGQGDGILIRSEGAACMIDGGSSDETQVGTYVISPALRSQGIGRLDAVFLTHPDDDHVNGIVELLEQIANGTETLRISGLYVPAWMEQDASAESIRQAAARAGVPVTGLETGDRVTLGESVFTVLFPGAGTDHYEQDPNSGSLVLKLENRDFTALFTGDLPETEEEHLGAAFACDFLKIAHHGSETSTGAAFLNRYQPEIAAFSCGKNNRYGHPSAGTLERLHNAGVLVYGTVQSGALKLYRERGHYYMEGFLDSETYHVL